jgi:hypothetical protein
MSRIVIALLSAAVLVTLACCGSCSYVGVGDQASGGCTSILPPETFQESDLVGTWVARYGHSATDTLIIKADGTYKQIYTNSITGYHFESDWLKWWIEYTESGIPHLYMQEMRKCDGISEDCRREGGGGGDSLWFDYCEERLIHMRGEVVLLVVGVPERFAQPPRGILLRQLSINSDSFAGTFLLQE